MEKKSKLCDKFKLEKSNLSYADFHSEDLKNVKNMTSSSSDQLKQCVGRKLAESEEIVRYMSSLPNYLASGNKFQDKALNLGVMDWGRLEKWHSTPRVKLAAGNFGKFQDLNNGLGERFVAENGMIRKYESFHKSQMEARLKECRDPGMMTSFSKAKMKIQEDESDRHPYEKRSIEASCQSSCSDNSMKGNAAISSKSQSIPLRRYRSCSRDSSSIPQKAGDRFHGNYNQLCLEKNKTSFILLRDGSDRHPHEKISNLVTLKFHSDRPDASDDLAMNSPNVSSRAHSSPLRRLLDPLFSSRATKFHQSAEPLKEASKMKVKASTMQALFQIAVKNGRPLFTFAVESSSEVLAATVRRLTSPLKDGSRWIYTFFTIQEVKKNTASWLTSSTKVKGHGYVPHIVGQMKVSDSSVPNREFVLFSVNLRPSDQQILDIHPRDELAAIVVKFPGKAIREDYENHFRTTVILPGGHHGLPSKGKPSTLIERWRSGGLCDCGGWDIGCRMKVLANQNQTSRKSNASRVHLPNNQFELFSEGEFQSEGPLFSMSPLKENIYSVKFNPSLSFLQAFSTCISVVECRKSCQLLSESSNFFEDKLSEEALALNQEEVLELLD